ncbi:hypothetical protein FGADI_2130 [Fusarium gaditjirri]|uniref:Uncharacterized protein n=1 Tax=Fusarium gaditjirri TaxID=282569 RepID=A0A8H4X2R2_9HYPO|nr:hypothetical protein FGADI_2130 [Fusarium gaditjirri]
MCAEDFPAQPTSLMTGDNTDVPGQPSQPGQSVLVPSAGPCSVPHVSIPNEPMNSASFGNPDKPGAGGQNGDPGQSPPAAEPTSAGHRPDPSASNDPHPASSSSGQSNPAKGHDGSAGSDDGSVVEQTSPAPKASETPLTVATAPGSRTKTAADVMVIAGIVACLTPILIH